MRRVVLSLLCLLLAAAAIWFLWQRGSFSANRHGMPTVSVVAPKPGAGAGSSSAVKSASLAVASKNRASLRLTNTTRSIAELVGDSHAILLENAFLDTTKPLNLTIPDNLKLKGNPGAYIVQARGLINNGFRAVIARAGGRIVSYIPNDAYLVELTPSEAGYLADNTLVQAVLPYEPYYKLQPSLLSLAVANQPLTPGTALNLVLFPADATPTENQLIALGAKPIGTLEQSPFGPILRVLAPVNWTALMQVPGVQIAERVPSRVLLNDLSRVTVGESTDTVTPTNYLNLSGANVMVAVADTGIDTNHPDFGIGGGAGHADTVPPTRVWGYRPGDFVDTAGHGTFVAGEIAGNGSESTNMGSIPEGSVTNADFRGKAPAADLFSINFDNSDPVLQQEAALTNALISNNSWGYGGDAEYDIAAASYDAATRDALPFTSGSQPVLFVFAAGDSGGGDDSGAEGSSDSILSPGTAKNVITVGALEQLRNITNIVTTITGTGTNVVTNQVAYWQPKTDSSDQVAGYSSRGNVGVNTEGVYGRFKPDVVAPGTFVVSTSSGIPPDYQWNTNAYYNPTNVSTTTYFGQTVDTNSLLYYNVTVPPNAVAVTINITSNALSIPFPSNMPIYVQQSGYPTTTTYDFVTTNDSVSIPPDGPVNYLSQILNSGFYFAIGNNTNVSANSVNYDVTVSIYTTNDDGNLYSVLQGMNNAIGPWYRYESGTSMSAAEASGVLALIDDYFTNTLQTIPSPALLKAMLINGSRSIGSYDYGLTNGINFQGWGLINIANSLPLATNSPSSPMIVGASSSLNQALFVVDQNMTNALATGDSHTYFLSVNNSVGSIAPFLNLQATLVWTDPAGDPSAAIKLVNNLDLIVTNLDTGEVYFGNDISPSLGFNLAWVTNTTPNLDSINNVENIFLNPISSGEELGSNYSITVVGRQVNVNSLTAQTNNVLQDYALVVSIGEGEQPDAITSVTDVPTQSAPTTDQDITFVATTNAPLFDQFAGENWPLANTNVLALGSNTVWGTNAQLTIGQTNQWHFYVVTNNGLDAQGSPVDVTNAAFITFDPNTLSIPRMGVNEEANPANATRPEADIDLYVTTDPGLTNLNPTTIGNCLAGVGESGVSLSQGGTEFVYFTNSAPGEVYYVGVKSEDREASEYAFIPIFTATPFSQLNQNGDEIVNGLLLPMPIPDGNNANPGSTNIFALAINNMEVGNVIVTNWDQHQNFGDLLGVLSFDDTSSVLNNHAGLGNTFNTGPLIYDDSSNPIPGSRHTDVPGNLVNYQGKTAIGPWILTEVDDAPGSTGQVSQLTLLIQPHRNLLGPGIIVTVPPLGWFIDYVDVSPGYTNLTFDATNLPPTIAPLPLQMYEQLNAEPTLNAYDQREDLTNCVPGTGPYPVGIDPGNDISVGPPLNDGRYFVGIYNPSSSQSATVFLSASLGLGTGVNDVYTYSSGTPTTLTPDAVTDDSVFVAATQQVASVNVGIVVKSPQIADYTFTLVSPTGQRVLLMENRGGGTTNGAGSIFVYTNILSTTATGGGGANTNYLTVSDLGETVPVIYDFFTVPDEMTIFEGTNPATFTPANISNPYFLFDSGFTNNLNGPETFNINVPPGYTNITIIMNEFGNPYSAQGDDWNYTAGAPATNYQYLEFTDDSNLANVPIKFAIPPYDFTDGSSNFTLSDFELATNGDYHGVTNIYDLFGGWTVPTNLLTIGTIVTNDQILTVTNQVEITNNEVSVVTDPFDSLGDNAGTNFLALAKGTITRLVPTIPGRDYNLTFWYRGPGIAGWWRGEGNATDSSDPENNGNNGRIVGQINYVAGFVGQAFQFPDLGNEFDFGGTNGYVQIPQNPSLDVGKGGGLTVEGWIQPTNVARPQPLVEWLAGVPTNSTGTNVNPAVTNLTIIAGPYLDRANGNYYYLLNATNWTISEIWAEALGGHLATVNNANEQNWIFDNFGDFDGINRNLWIGLTNAFGVTFSWVSGQTNVPYTNWVANQPNNQCGPEDYTFMYGNTNLSAGLWTAADTNGFVCGLPNVTNIVYGVVEVTNLQTNGVQFWISVTNTPGTTNAPFVNSNGCLYANIVDTNFVSHEVISAPGLIVETNYYHHVALTFDNSNGIAKLFLDGTNIVTTNLFLIGGNFVPFVPKTDGDVLLGRDMTMETNNFYTGDMDEMSVYRRALSDAEISAIYFASVLTNNFNIGKFDPSVTPAAGLAEARVVFNNNTTNILFGVNNQWQEFSYTFTATTNSLPLQITGLEPGILLDQFAVAEAPLTNLYYLPEQSLSALTGTSANGNWTLQVWDNITQTLVNPSELVDWSLTFVLNSNATVAATLQPETPGTITVGPGQVVDLLVPVPAWAQYASNLVVSTSPSGSPVDMFFNPTNPPTGSNPGDQSLLANATGSPVGALVAVNQPLPLQPLPAGAGQAGSSYYLGVRNNGSHAVQVTVEVDFDITALTNGVPLSSYLTNNDSGAVRYFSFDVSSNAYEATFQLLKLTSNADLVVSKGAPLPTLTSSDYGSFNATNADENIYVLTNSTPVPLSAGTWYLGVVRRDVGPVFYTVLAKELDATNGMTNLTIINLTNGVPFNWTAGPGAALTNFFSFVVTNTVTSTVTNLVQGVRFELYNLTGNGDLIVQTNALPLSPPFFETSQNPGQIPEQMLIFTNREMTNMAANWYLGVPNNEITNISYTILAVIETNSYFPAFPGASGSGGGALGGGRVGMPGDVYHVTTNSDSGPGSLRDAIDTATTNRTVVFDISGVVNLLSPLIITNSYLDIAGETAPGIGITVAGQMTALTNAHDVIIRDIRFRRGSVDDSLQLSGVSNVVADHVSAEWSDRLLSVLNSTNVTVQWSIMADSLYLTNSAATNPPTGSFLRYGSGAISLNHNLYADNYSGSPYLGDNLSLDFVNNVIYNWGLFSGLAGGTNDLDYSTTGCTNQLNYTCNYLIAGPDTANFATNYSITNIAFFGGVTNGLAANWIFQSNNIIDSNTNGILDGANTQWAMFTNDYTKFQVPFPLVTVPTDEAFLAYEKVLDFAGPDMDKRDPADTNIVLNVRTQTGRLISYSPLAGLVGWWKGESNTVDSVNGNNGTFPNGGGYTAGEVGTAFNFDGINQYMLVQATNSDLDVGKGTGFTFEAWIKPTALTVMIICEYENILGSQNGADDGVQFGTGSGTGVGDLVCNIKDIFNVDHVYFSNPGLIVAGVWQHVALTYDKASGVATYYRNGISVGTMNMGSFTPQTTFTNFLTAKTIYNSVANPIASFNGALDELSVYKRALSSNEIASIYQAGSAGKFANPPAVQPYLDTDQDGIPDFWEWTFTPTNVFVPSNNNDRNGSGYTDLEEYNNWLAGLHALTVTNTPVGVDLLRLFGKTGNLSFSVTNGVHGSVYLTNVLGAVTNTGLFSNSIAIFTPTNNLGAATNYNGYASFDVYVTNNDTIGYFGPATVNVAVSAVPIATNLNFPPVITPLVSGTPVADASLFGLSANAQSNTRTNTGGSDYYKFTVGTNGVGENPVEALFAVTNASGPVELVVSYGLPLPSLSSYDYISDNPFPANQSIVVISNSTPVGLTNGDWYLAVVNVSGSNVTYDVVATALYSVVPPLFIYPTNGDVFTNIETTLFTVACQAVDSNTPPLPLTYGLTKADPTNMTINSSSGIISWTPTEAQGPSTNTIYVSVSNGDYGVTNSFTVIVEESNLPPVLPVIPDQVVSVPGTLVVTNTATDPDIPINTLTYQLVAPPTGATIDPNSGIITWTPTAAQAGTTYVITTIVTDYNPWAVNSQHLSDTNSFLVVVASSVTVGTPQTNTAPSGITSWFAVHVPKNAVFATNILLYATNLPVNVWYSPNVPPTTTNANDYDLMPNATSGVSVLTPTLTPTNIVPGGTYYLGVQNPNAVAVGYSVEVDFLLSVPISSIVHTNISGTNGYLLTWFGHSNYLFEVKWTANLTSTNWNTFTNVITYNPAFPATATNAQFNFFDDGSQTGGLGPWRFYQLQLFLQPPNALTLPVQTNYVASVGVPLVITNTATETNVSYVLKALPSPLVLPIETNGIISWTPGAADASGEFKFTTIVSDNGVPPSSATNAFTVFVLPYPSITNVLATATNVTLSWGAPAGDLFEVEWATNLAPGVVWSHFAANVTSATGSFRFTDPTPPSAKKFYRLSWQPLP